MNKFRNSLLSVAAAAAMASTALTANYVPLTSSANDDRWVLFGVGAFATDGTAATEPGVFRIVSSIRNTVTDTDQTDDVFGFGLQATGGKNLGSVKAISSGVVLEVRVDTTTDSIPYVETEPFRTMYVDTTGEGSPTFAFTYKASLEGLTLEYSVDDGLAYELTISSAGTYSDPIAGVKISGLDATSGTYSLTDLTGTDSAVDFDFNNNPQVATEFRTTHRDDKSGNENIRAYSYDAANKLWDIYDSANTAGTNNFTELAAGKAYWAKMDNDTTSGADNPSGKQGGVVLGTPDISVADYTAANLVDGWNLIAFDAKKPNIRHSSTGMKVDLNATATENLTILDSSNTQSVDVNASGGAVVVSKRINSALYAAKLNGTIPYTLDIKSFPSAANSIVLMSNKRFSLQDTGSAIVQATSLFDAKLLDPTSLEAITDYNVSTTGVTSKYGEYALIVEPLTGAGTASAIEDGTSKIEIEAYEGPLDTDTNKTSYSVNTSSSVFATAITHASLKASVLSLDINTTYNDVLITSEHPFNLRDQTFTRVFEFLTTNSNPSDVTITGADSQNKTATTIAANANATTGAAAVATALDAAVPALQVTSTGKYVVTVANIQAAADYKVYEDADLLKVATASSVGDLSKGGIAGVYSLDYLSGLTVKNNTEINTTQFVLGVDANDTNDSMIITYTTEFQDINGTSFAANSGGFTLDSGENNLTVINAVVAAINTDFADLGMTSTASHDYNKSNISSYKITITGEDIKGVSMNKIEGSTGAGPTVVAATASDTGYTNTPTPDIAADLKNNSVYAPDYVLDGPLYTMKENGMTLKALVTGTTKLTDGTVAWDSVDLTRKPSEWLDSQDYNLFKVDAKAGYWAFLEADTGANNLAIALTPIVGTYVHHFDGTDNKTYNTFTANLEVTITGLTASDTFDGGKAARVTATINGKTTELTRNSGTDVFDGKISNNETEGFSTGSNYELVIDVSDGLGYKYQETFANAFDNVQPAKPVTSSVNGVIQVDTNDTSVAGFYVYNGAIDENNPTVLEADGGNLMGHLTAAGTVTAACETAPAVSWNSSAGTIRIISVDGTGILGGGNASDAETENFMPILKERVFLENTNNGTASLSTGGLAYDASCVTTGVDISATVTTGVGISAITTDKVVKLAYPNLGEKVVTAVPMTVYVQNTAGTVAQINYPSTYVGKSVFIEIDGDVFGYLLPDASLIGTTEKVSSTPKDLELEASNPKSGITL